VVKVLFLCHGNICRSPMAEYIFKSISKDVYCESKAVSSEEIGNPIYPPAASVLKAHGISFENHRARKMQKSDYEGFDLIIIMEEYNRKRLMSIIGDDSQGKVHRLLEFADFDGDIEDPWYSGNFEGVFGQIEKGCKGLLNYINNGH